MSRRKSSMTIDEAFRVLQLGLQWGCGNNWNNMSVDSLTEVHVLRAFREEIRFIGNLILLPNKTIEM